MPKASQKLPRALLFDMDGTLTKPLLDFPKIKAELGIGTQSILEAIAKMEDARRREAREILERHERSAAEQSALNPGCKEILRWLALKGIPVAMITRNSRECATTVLHRHQLDFQGVITREDAPFKPSPEGLLIACNQLRVKPEDVWMVGDGRFDIEAAAAAKISSIWVSHGRSRDFPSEPWKTVSDLRELLDLLKNAEG